MNYDLSTFSKNSGFYSPKSFLLTVKSFDLREIRARYLKSRASKTGRVGSVERRKLSKGGLVYVEIENGYIKKHEILSFLIEPRGLDIARDAIAISCENRVHVLRQGRIEHIDNPWFSYIHTVHFNHRSGPDSLLVSSSGYDCIFEYDLEKYDKSWEWFAWENGFRKGYDPATDSDILLTRNAREASRFREEGRHYLFIKDPEKQVLPTAQRAAFINSVVYDSQETGKLLATFFHEGAVYRIDKASGKCEKIMDGMKSPHGGRNYRRQYMATSTATGELHFSNGDRISFAGLPGKPDELADLEWLQNSAPFEDVIITIDSNRNAFVITDLKNRQYDMVSYDPDWAIQDIAGVTQPGMSEMVAMIKEKL